MNRKAVIFGIKGHYLTASEKLFLKKSKPWGIILFERNVKNLPQLKRLTQDIKKIINDKNYPILIDMEGGKVSRLNNIMDFTIFSQAYFGNLYTKKKKLFCNYYKVYINAVCNILNEAGVNINTVPVLDIRRKNAHHIIGNRSFSKSTEKVSILGKLWINQYKKNKIATVMKHIPGHGLSKYDSHFDTPRINTNKQKLIEKDFQPFRLCESPFAMTAHVVYSKFDSINTATHSKKIIKEIIRKHIQFRGLLISDDISMKSLKFTLENNAIKAIKAGCNLVLHCNGDIDEMKRLAKVIPNIDSFTQKKTSHFYKFLR